jgi:hypothetical protein
MRGKLNKGLRMLPKQISQGFRPFVERLKDTIGKIVAQAPKGLLGWIALRTANRQRKRIDGIGPVNLFIVKALH